MSYDIRLNRFSDEPASEQQVEAAFEVLTCYGARRSERADRFSVQWEDGSGFTMFSKSLSERPVRFYALLNPLGDLSQKFCDFIYQFATAIDCTICPDVIPPLTVVIHSGIVGRLPPALTASTVVQVNSAVALRNVLAPSYYRWRGITQDLARRLDESISGDPAGGA